MRYYGRDFRYRKMLNAGKRIIRNSSLLLTAIDEYNDTNDIELLFRQHTRLKETCSTHRGELHGPCPICGGEDRFMVWPKHPEGPRAWCRQCERWGDCLRWSMYLRDIDPDEPGATTAFLKEECYLPDDEEDVDDYPDEDEEQDPDDLDTEEDV